MGFFTSVLLVGFYDDWQSVVKADLQKPVEFQHPGTLKRPLKLPDAPIFPVEVEDGSVGESSGVAVGVELPLKLL